MVTSVQSAKRLKFALAAILFIFASLALVVPQGHAQSGETCSFGESE